MDPETKQPEPAKGPAPTEPTPQPSPSTEPNSSMPTDSKPADAMPEPAKDSINLAQPASDTTTNVATRLVKKNSGLKIVFIIIAIVVLVIGGILISTFLLAPNLFKATAPSQNTSNNSDNSSSQTDSSTNSTKTIADETLQKDIIKNIVILDTKATSSSVITVVSVKTLPKTGNTYNEEWTVDVDGTQTVYSITITPTPDGGSDFTVKKKV